MAVELTQPNLSVRTHLKRTDASSSIFQLDVDFWIPPGITILFGPSGAGKSTLLDCIAGLITPDEGRITISEDLLFDSATHINVPAQKRHLGYLFQSPALFPHLTAQQNVEYGLSNLPTADRANAAQKILKLFRVETLASRKPAELSGGEAQRVALARSLVTQPRVLLLDEPLSGLDVTSALIVKNLIQALSARGKSIFYCSHILEVVEKVCTRLIVLRKGKVIAHGATSEVRERIGTSSLEGVFLHLVEEKDVTKTANEIVDVVVSA